MNGFLITKRLLRHLNHRSRKHVTRSRAHPGKRPEAARPFLQTALNNSGYIPNLLGVLANAPAALETYLTVSGLNAKASLGLPEREVVQLVAATTHGCDFCVAGHTAVARNKARLPGR